MFKSKRKLLETIELLEIQIEGQKKEKEADKLGYKNLVDAIVAERKMFKRRLLKVADKKVKKDDIIVELHNIIKGIR